MHFIPNCNTDAGTLKTINQDSLLVKHARYGEKEILMAVVCDGLGGLAKGELASATVAMAFSDWFDKELIHKLRRIDFDTIAKEWVLKLKNLNEKILEYSRKLNLNMGTTFSAILFIGEMYLIVHIGDSRIYQIDSKVKQLTTDHTLIAQEVNRGNMTIEQAKKDKRRNVLLQCVGAIRSINPQIIISEAKKSVYMICSDGFRNEISGQEIYEYLNPSMLKDKKAMDYNAKYLIDLAKKRGEKDNISVILIKAD